MKTSFLPKDQTTGIRLIALTPASTLDPLFLIRQNDTTILVGSGFSTIQRAGHTYQAFPDMRLIHSEKDRINAWILMDESIDVTAFQAILPTLEDTKALKPIFEALNGTVEYGVIRLSLTFLNM